MSAPRKVLNALVAVFATITLSLALPSLAAAQESTAEQNATDTSDKSGTNPVENAEEVKEAFAKDKTGTNPLNFTFDARLYDEYRWLNTAGDGSQNLLTAEFRMPIAGGKWQLRGKVRSNDLKADFNNDGFDDVDESGFGDTDIRFATVPYFNMEKKLAVFAGVEFFLDTASEDALGAGATSVAPFAFVVFLNPFGPGTIFVPGYQHTISIDEDDGRDKVHQGLIDMFLVKTWSENKYWGYVDPQIILDYEQDVEFGLLEIQAGMMIGAKGHSIYAMPSFGVGTNRPYDFSLEIGYKIVW